MYKIAICDDCKEYRKTLVSYIKKESTNQADLLIYQYDTGQKLLENRGLGFDLIFLDMQLSDMSGSDVAARIRKDDKEAVLVFCSGVYMPNPELFNVNPFRYLIKQKNEEETQETIHMILEYVRNCRKREYFTLTGDGSCTRIEVNDILYFSIIKRGSEVHLYDRVQGSEQVLKTKENISDIEVRMRNRNFALIHKSYLVNLQYVSRVMKNSLIMENGTELPVSRSKRDMFLDKFSSFMRIRY